MNKAIFQFAASSIHFATSLEILREETKFGHEIYYNLWSARTKYPGRMSVDFEGAWGKPPRWTRRIVKKAGSTAVYSSRMTIDNVWVENSLTQFKFRIQDIQTIAQLRQIEFAGIRPGAALVNELTTLTKNRNFSPRENLRLIVLLTESYLQVYIAAVRFINIHDIREVHLFNGRFLHERAVWDAAKSLGVQVILFETTRNRYFQRKEGFHDRINNQKVMLAHWENSDLTKEQRVDVGSEYFAQLRSKANPFHTLHKPSIDITRPYFLYFSSSDDEMAGLWDEDPKSLGDQISCVRKLQLLFDAQSTYQLIIRIHPNLLNKSLEQQLAWAEIRESNSTKICGPGEEISSYSLLDNAIGSISFGSTVGLESAFALKPSLVLTECGYDLLGVVDIAETWEDVSNWLKFGHQLTPAQLSDRKTNSCIRGFFLATGGRTLENTHLVEIGWGAWVARSFDEVKLPDGLFSRIYHKVVSKVKFLRVLRYLNHG